MNRMSLYEMLFGVGVHLVWALYCIWTVPNQEWFIYAFGVIAIQFMHRIFVRVGR